MNQSPRYFLALLIALVLTGTGCSRNDANHQQEIDELRQELDQLANAVGRLEFRIYELENHHPRAAESALPSTDSASRGDAAESPTPATTEPTDQAVGAIDLTPVE